MKIKEDHIIAALILMIIIVIWSKFTRMSAYGPGQQGTPQTIPTPISIKKDIVIDNWVGSGAQPAAAIFASANNGNTKGACCLSNENDYRLGPGDLNRQGWAMTTTPTALGSEGASGTPVQADGTGGTKPIFVGFRKQLKVGGGGQVWYLFSYSGFMPTGSSYLQDQDAASLITLGTFSIPQYVIYVKSVVSPFADQGCAYVVTNTGTCSATACTNAGGTAIQTLLITKLATGENKNCFASDQTTDLSLITGAGGGSIRAVTGVSTGQSITADGPSGTVAATTPDSALNGGGAFTQSATAGTTTCYYASLCYPPGCAGKATGGFLQNSGAVMTIAGTGASGAIDGIGTLGRITTNTPAAQFISPAFICAGGSAITHSNVIVSNVAVAAASGSITLRSMWKTNDTPPLWQVASFSNTSALITSAVTCSGLAVDWVAAATGAVYVACSAANKIYKITNYGGTLPTLAAVWTMPLGSTLGGICIDSSSTTPAGNYIYAICGSNLFIIPVATATATLSSATNMIAVTGLLATPKYPALDGPNATATGGGTLYYTDVGWSGNGKIYQVSIPTIPVPFAPSSASATNNTQWAGGNQNAGTTGGINIGNLNIPSANNHVEITVDKNGSVYIPAVSNHTISKTDAGGNIYPYVGGKSIPPASGAAGVAGNQGAEDTALQAGNTQYPGGGAAFRFPQGITLSPDRITFFVADTGNHNIRMII